MKFSNITTNYNNNKQKQLGEGIVMPSALFLDNLIVRNVMNMLFSSRKTVR